MAVWPVPTLVAEYDKADCAVLDLPAIALPPQAGRAIDEVPALTQGYAGGSSEAFESGQVCRAMDCKAF